MKRHPSSPRGRRPPLPDGRETAVPPPRPPPRALSSQRPQTVSKRRAHTRRSHARPRKSSSSSFPPRTMRPTGPRCLTTAPSATPKSPYLAPNQTLPFPTRGFFLARLSDVGPCRAPRACEGPASETLQHCRHPLHRHCMVESAKGSSFAGPRASVFQRLRGIVPGWAQKLKVRPRHLLVQMLVFILCRTKFPSKTVRGRPEYSGKLGFRGSIVNFRDRARIPTRLHAGDDQPLAGAGGGDVEELELGAVDVFEFRLVRSRVYSGAQRQGVLVAGYDGDRFKFEALGEVHRADRDPARPDRCRPPTIRAPLRPPLEQPHVRGSATRARARKRRSPAAQRPGRGPP